MDDRAVDADCVGRKLWVGSVPLESYCQHFDVIVLCAMEFQHIELSCHTARFPLDDNGESIPRSDRVTALAAAKVVHSFRTDGKRVLVTCAQGKNRSALVAALALVLEGMNADEAIRRVREHRKLPPPHKALANLGFVEFLREVGKNRQVFGFLP